jgi:hypothetical protein
MDEQLSYNKDVFVWNLTTLGVFTVKIIILGSYVRTYPLYSQIYSEYMNVPLKIRTGIYGSLVPTLVISNKVEKIKYFGGIKDDQVLSSYKKFSQEMLFVDLKAKKIDDKYSRNSTCI